MKLPERLTSITELAKAFASVCLKPGDMAVDCTAGNGHDTLFLAEMTAPDGFVHAFDIQPQAITVTKQRLEKAGVSDRRYSLIQECHSRITEYVPSGIAACMFNLGYLPGASRHITTKPASVIQALQGACRLLRPCGVITVVMYSGHAAGRRERDALLEYAASVDEKAFRVIHVSNLNTSKSSPSILVFQKL